MSTPGILYILREEWEVLASSGEAPASYLTSLRTKVWAVAQLAQAELAHAQEVQMRWYDENVWPHSFQQGQRVLLLLLSLANKLLMIGRARLRY